MLLADGMSNRLPPAWSKHLKSAAAPKPRWPQASPPQSGPPNANSFARAQADDALLKKAYEHQQAKRLGEAQDLCLQVLARTPNHPLALYIMGTVCLGYDDEAALRYFARAVAAEPGNAYYHLSFGEAYAKFDQLQAALDGVPNLFLIGRNGMHRYNNQDHSMLTAKEAARQIAAGAVDKAAIWGINVDDEYHEVADSKHASDKS